MNLLAPRNKPIPLNYTQLHRFAPNKEIRALVSAIAKRVLTVALSATSRFSDQWDRICCLCPGG